MNFPTNRIGTHTQPALSTAHLNAFQKDEEKNCIEIFISIHAWIIFSIVQTKQKVMHFDRLTFILCISPHAYACKTIFPSTLSWSFEYATLIYARWYVLVSAYFKAISNIYLCSLLILSHFKSISLNIYTCLRWLEHTIFGTFRVLHASPQIKLFTSLQIKIFLELKIIAHSVIVNNFSKHSFSFQHRFIQQAIDFGLLISFFITEF